MKCRFCDTSLRQVFIDLGSAPPSNAFLAPSQLGDPEPFYPLRAFVCHHCYLVQVEVHQKPDAIFADDYAYFSSYSRSWLAHAKQYVAMITARLGLDRSSRVLEIASNDGYLLQYMAERGIPCVGIEPARCTADAARKRGVETLIGFFGTDQAESLVRERGRQDLIIGNNVLAHVPDLNDFVHGLSIALAPSGTITLEFPHILRMIESNQFDTIYHEHFSYLSLLTVESIFEAHGLKIHDVEELPTHGGSLRIYVRHVIATETVAPCSVESVRATELAAGLRDLKTYRAFQRKADTVRDNFLTHLQTQRNAGRRVAAYGAAAKGNTLLNYCGIRSTALIPYVVDASPHKQGKFLPGSRIPVVAEDYLRNTRPDEIIILPWNLREEISAQLTYVRNWGARFVVAVPELEVF